jgi:hypothetical protein
MQDFETKVVAGAGTTNRLLATEFNQVATELENLRSAGGLAADSGSLTQLAASTTSHVLRGNFYTDSGSANAYVLVSVGSFVAPTSYSNGQVFRFIAANTNTGASTINVASIGAINILSRDGVALKPRDVVANDYIEAYCTGTEMRIINSAPLYNQLSYNYEASAAPVYASTTTLTVARISCRDYLNGIDINKTSSSTLNIATYGLGGIIQSTNRTGTVTFTSGTATLSSSGVDLTTIFQPGDVIEADGASVQARRIVSLTSSTAVVSDNWTVSGTAVTYRRGGRAINTPYLIYAYNANGNVGLFATTRNIAIGDTIPDTVGGVRYQLLGITKGSGTCGYCFSLNGSGIIRPFKWVGNKAYYITDVYVLNIGNPNSTDLPRIIPIGAGGVAFYSYADTSFSSVATVSTTILPTIIMYGENGGSNQISAFNLDVPVGNDRLIYLAGSLGPCFALGIII